MGLRTFHLVFILFAIMGADLYGGWAVHDYRVNGELPILVFGIVSLIGGLGLSLYVIKLVRGLDRAHIE